MKRFIIMDEKDTIATALEDTFAGEVASIYSSDNEKVAEVKVLENISFGNKIALKDIAVNDPIIKYGSIVGQCKKNILKGELVHVHNVKSNVVDIPSSVQDEIMKQVRNAEIKGKDKKALAFKGYGRPDGSVGIRNKLLIIAVDECCEGIARSVAKEFDDAVVLTNWYTCMLGGNEEIYNQMIAVGENPNVAGVLVIAMGCGSISASEMANRIAETGKPAYSLVCEELGGTKNTVKAGIEKLKLLKEYADSLEREEFPLNKLVIGVKCGGSDTSSGIASNPSVGAAVDKLVELGATCIAGELFELQGCQEVLNKRAKTPEVAEKINQLIENERIRWSVEGTEVETMSIGNSVGGLTTIEEKSMGALHKTGTSTIVDILQINKDFIDKPKEPGFYLSEATMLCGGGGVNFASFGAHIILWTTGAAGFNNPIVPTIRVSGNEELINEDIDIDATGVMKGTRSINDVAEDIVKKVQSVASGSLTNVEGIGESTLTLYQKDQRLEKLLNIPCVRGIK